MTNFLARSCILITYGYWAHIRIQYYAKEKHWPARSGRIWGERGVKGATKWARHDGHDHGAAAPGTWIPSTSRPGTTGGNHGWQAKDDTAQA